MAVSAATDFAFPERYSSTIPSRANLVARQHPAIELPDHLFVISVLDWLRALFGPSVTDDRDIAEWASRRWINFTHFGALGHMVNRETPIQRAHMAEAWMRQIAFTSIIAQPEWNILVVCLELD
jgi:hypothetical protein